jgi:DNA (cytosine-5)-methyltransferase 1
LLAEVSRLAAELNPEWVLIENVPGLARVKGRSTYNRFLSSLEKLQYQYAVGVLDAKRYGVPQTRRRLVLIASRNHTPSLPSPTHGEKLTPYRTVRDAISHLPKSKAIRKRRTAITYRRDRKIGR